VSIYLLYILESILNRSWAEAWQKLDRSWTEAGQKLDRSWTEEAGQKLNGLNRTKPLFLLFSQHVNIFTLHFRVQTEQS
jgi:hypothetical protein